MNRMERLHESGWRSAVGATISHRNTRSASTTRRAAHRPPRPTWTSVVRGAASAPVCRAPGRGARGRNPLARDALETTSSASKSCRSSPIRIERYRCSPPRNAEAKASAIHVHLIRWAISVTRMFWTARTDRLVGCEPLARARRSTAAVPKRVARRWSWSHCCSRRVLYLKLRVSKGWSGPGPHCAAAGAGDRTARKNGDRSPPIVRLINIGWRLVEDAIAVASRLT